MVESLATVIAMPAPTKVARLPEARNVVQVASLYSETVTTSAAAVPLISGLLLLAGEAGVVVAHYRGELGRKPDFFHGKADGSNPEDLSKCYHCGYETYRLLSHCPRRGSSMQSKRWSRRYGAILSVLGLIISSVIGFVLLLLLPKLLYAGASSGGMSFSGPPAQAWLVLSVLVVVELFGVTTMCYGLWQVVTGRRSMRVVYFAFALVPLLVVVGFFL